MNKNQSTKATLLEKLFHRVNTKIEAIEASMADIAESMRNDTKSSAGDKFETGREMMQLELNKQQSQLNLQRRLKNDLAQIIPEQQCNSVDFGSLVISNKGNYFVSVAMGKISLDNTSYYALSLASPIGQALKGKQQGDIIQFNKQSIEILEIK